MEPNVFILMGVSATGKTTLGNALAHLTQGKFYDGDDYHPESNCKKMASGVALTDEDRKPWLEILAELITQRSAEKLPSFIACSALKKSYRTILQSGDSNLVFIHLHTDPKVLRERISKRFEAGEHFMPPSLLDSQLATLEIPSKALVCDVSQPVEKMLELITKAYPHLLLKA